MNTAMPADPAVADALRAAEAAMWRAMNDSAIPKDNPAAAAIAAFFATMRHHHIRETGLVLCPDDWRALASAVTRAAEED